MRPLTRLVALVRADVPISQIDPLRTAGGDAYQMIDDAPPASWARLAAWTAFMLQLYGNNLVGATEPTGFVPADTAVIVRQLYSLVGVWLERARQLEASPEVVLDFRFPNPLPSWPTFPRSNPELKGMRDTLEAARARVGTDLRAYAGPPDGRNELESRMVAVDSALESVELLWVGRGSDELRAAIGEALGKGLAQANELGQLLAQPALLGRLHG